MRYVYVDLVDILSKFIHLQNILLRDISLCRWNCQKRKSDGKFSRIDKYDWEWLKREMEITGVTIACIEYILKHKMTITQFCVKFNLSIANFNYRIHNNGVVYEDYEMKNLKSNNIIH